jgi:UDP-hydrolysing UDP-N-acetyl-D-glucosamine 2-epimerase
LDEKLGCIALFIGSRANHGRLQSVISAIRKSNFRLHVIVAASGLWEGIQADDYISCLVQGDGTREMALTSGLLHLQLVQVLDKVKPDCVIVHGDRYEVLNVAQVAAYMNIPIAHGEGGEITGTIDDKVRYAITALADYHFVTTELSASRIHKSNTFIVGSTAIDNVASCNLKPVDKDFILALMHPNTTDPEQIEPLINALEGKNVVWINPNVDAGSQHSLKKIYDSGFKITKGLGPKEYYKLLSECSILVGNTSSGIKEGAYLGKPYVCIGTRQSDREHEQNTLFVKNETTEIKYSIETWEHSTFEYQGTFGNGNAGQKIMKKLEELLC